MKDKKEIKRFPDQLKTTAKYRISLKGGAAKSMGSSPFVDGFIANHFRAVIF